MFHPFFFFPRRGGRCRVLVSRSGDFVLEKLVAEERHIESICHEKRDEL
jgi:hypothetical protein